MTEELNIITTEILDRFSDLKVEEFRGQSALIVPPERIVEVCQALRDEHGFQMLTGQSAVDYWPKTAPRFHVVYMLLSLERKVHLILRVPVDGEEPELPTVETIFPNANWYEREIWDMFGVRFSGHSDLRRLLMPHDWEGHPLRKDYPLGYEEVQFSFNYDEIDVRKPYAKE